MHKKVEFMDLTSPSEHDIMSSNVSSCSTVTYTNSPAAEVTTPTNDSVVDTSELNSVSMYVEDQRNVEPDKSMPYILMLARGIHEDIPKMVDISTGELFKKALELNLLKKKAISLSKPMLCQELKRRTPQKKLNMNNKKVDDLFTMLDDQFLSETDKNYINRKVYVYLEQLKKGVEEAKDKRKDAGGRIECTDRLRYIMTIDVCGSIREAYMRSQDVLSRQALDARNTASAVRDFHDLVVAKFNDPTWIPSTTPNPDLHSYFSDEIDCAKREYYTMTREKSKQLLLDMKHKLNEICKRYDRSGNGAGQVDSDEEEVVVTDDRNFGRFNIELAKLKGGDDRQNFLNHEPVDLLYWWDVMDRHDLIHFTTAQLRGENAATSDSRPSLTSYGESFGSSVDGNNGNNARKRSKKNKCGDNDLLAALDKEMKDNVSTVGFALCKMNEQSVMEQIDDLTHKKRQLKNDWRKEKKGTQYDSDEDGEFYKNAIDEIEELITAKQEYLESLLKEHSNRS